MTETTFGEDRIGDAGIVRIRGDLTAGCEAGLMDAYARAATPGTRAVILDFSGLDYMNSGGIGLLVTLLVRVQRAGQRLLAFGLSEHYRLRMVQVRGAACGVACVQPQRDDSAITCPARSRAVTFI
jgi:anti-sigma B factor antagonist